MDIGIGTYALFWEWQDATPQPMGIAGMLDRAAELDCRVFQICDDPRVDGLSRTELTALRDQARDLGLRLELGTRTIGPDHLRRYLDIAEALGAPVLRSMIQRPEIAGGRDQAVAALREVLPRLEAQGTTLALETYEQVPTAELIAVVEEVASPRVGICLDPANCVSALEHPRDVVERTAAHVVDLHVKDFRFDRAEGWVGFTLSGARMGEGLLDLDHELGAVYREGRTPAAIVEHWLPWQGDLETTLRTERDWTRATLDALRTSAQAASVPAPAP